jgi:hypothetical protein
MGAGGAAAGGRAFVQLSALLYGTCLKQAVLATGRSHWASSGGAARLMFKGNAYVELAHLRLV